MSSPVIQIRPFDRMGASQAEYTALNRHTNRMRLERLPDDPPIPLAETIQNLQSIPSFVDLKLWAAWNPSQSEIVALGNVVIFRTEDNKHLVQFEITVLAEYRLQGLGRQFLGLIADATQKENRRLLMTNTVDRVPGGEAFMKRIMEKNLFARGSQRWTFFIMDRATGKFGGYTETIWNPNRPEVMGQGMTGVFPQYRNKGLGRWLKAVMLDKVLKERPQVKYVRTGNADSNAAMLKINTELGFETYMADTLWQVELQKVLVYLHSKPLYN